MGAARVCEVQENEKEKKSYQEAAGHFSLFHWFFLASPRSHLPILWKIDSRLGGKSSSSDLHDYQGYHPALLHPPTFLHINENKRSAK